MTKKEFKKLISKEGVILLDGSSGVELQKRGMPSNICPEKWAIENPAYLMKLQKEYIDSGSKIIYTFTFGANPVKLNEYGLKDETYSINKKLAKISKNIAKKKALVAGDIAPTGQFPEPFGDISFEEFVKKYKIQVKGLLDGGVDLFVIETMMDLQETRAAIFAVKELCNLPVIVSMTFDESKRTLTGTSPEAAVVSLQAIGIDAVGVNCSTGPDKMIEVVKLMSKYAKIPVIAKPNAGIPRLQNGKTVFDMDANTFASYTKKLISSGACLIGGCCGTNPEFIKLMKLNIIKPSVKIKKRQQSVLSSYSKVVKFDKKLLIVGERINPTGKKQLQQSLKTGNMQEIRKLAIEQIEKGADLLDVNVGMPGINEKDVMKNIINFLCKISDIPLCIDSSSPDVIENALRIYPGRALINSISGETKKLKKLLPLALKYGAMFILLPVDDKGVPATLSKRLKVIKKVLKYSKKYGFDKSDIIIDGIVMTVASEPDAPKQTLKLIEWAKKNGFKSIIGLSNVSFGLPERYIINSTFLYLAKKSGLNLVIANPSLDLKIKNKDAINVLLGKDKNCKKWIKKYGKISKQEKSTEQKKITKTIYDAVIKGEREIIKELVNNELKNGKSPSEIVDKILIPAINYVGELYDKKIYFLPQLVAAADTVKDAFSILEPLLLKTKKMQKKATIILATVKGDVHDIGKNIVALMLRNYGYNVIDLGKDVKSKIIIEKAKQLGADIIGLSALMTTTMIEMKTVIENARNNNLKCKIIIGGAVVTQSFANEIGADGYARDAYDAVKVVKNLLSF